MIAHRAARPPRRGIPKSVRFSVLQRDGFRCVYCGASAKEDRVPLHVDHVTPRSKGGADSADNLVTACEACNIGKGDRDGPADCFGRGQRAKAQENRGYPGCRTPLGYKRETTLEGVARISTLKIDPAGARTVRAIFAEYMKPAGSLRAVAKLLNERGVPPARGGAEWRSNSIERILRNPVYQGDVVWGRPPIIHRDAVPALVSREDFAEAARLLNERKRYTGKPTAANPLAGLCSCQICGSRLYSDGGGLLRCSRGGCSSRRIRVAPAFEDAARQLTRLLCGEQLRRLTEALQSGDARQVNGALRRVGGSVSLRLSGGVVLTLGDVERATSSDGGGE